MSLAQQVAEHPFTLRRGRCGGKTWPVSLVGICGKRELRHQEQLAACLADIEVHSPLFIGKYPVSQNPFQQTVRLPLTVFPLHGDQRQHAVPDARDLAAVNIDGGFGYSLQQCDHDQSRTWLHWKHAMVSACLLHSALPAVHAGHGLEVRLVLVFIATSVLRVLSWLPAGGPYWLARRLAGLWMRLSPTKRNSTFKNLERCYPDLSAEEREVLARESFVHYVASVLEAGHNWYWPVEKLIGRCDELVGRELLSEGLEAGKGVLVLAPHFGAWEYLGIYLQGFYDIAVLYKPPSDPRLDKALRDRRGRGGANMLPANAQGIRALFAHLRNGLGAGVLPDQEPSRGQGRFAPFFGVPALTGVLAPRIARKTGCKVVFAGCKRLPGGRYRIHVQPAEEAIADPDLDMALAALNRGVERCVELDPVQYLWSYKRFKTRPEGAPPFYS